MKGFYLNGENKNQLTKLTFDFIKQNRSIALSILKCSEIIMSGDEYCEKVTAEQVTIYDSLISNQEEADTKVVLHTLEALRATDENVCIRSPSGDTDIIVIAAGVVEESARVLVDSGNGEKRRKLWLDAITLTENQRKALIGFHAFSGNDYISAFFRKGKKMCWTKMLESDDFVNAFAELGNSWDVPEPLLVSIEKYVCHLYSSKKSKINESRFKIFEEKQNKSKQSTDLSILPPCESTLRLHTNRANHVARIWKCSGTALVDLPLPSQNGWLDDGTIQWITEACPDDVSSLLLNINGAESDFEEAGVETDDDSDDE